MTELEKVGQDPNFRFVIAEEIDGHNWDYNFILLKLEEFQHQCHPTIPPFKIYFNIDFDEIQNEKVSFRNPCNFSETDYKRLCKRSQEEKKEIAENKEKPISFFVKT